MAFLLSSALLHGPAMLQAPVFPPSVAQLGFVSCLLLALGRLRHAGIRLKSDSDGCSRLL
ncbi:hypothetical protein PAHAL_9G523600 [Panicum hallii]|uniref:Uncharacterized protein n=1 Tax=Panicum hallii TaxID=206008 RepID=A0A2T8I5G6_9POAL|nr:hypothetical protein PAHAL_9G523600 [Panicum hallii]